MPSPRRTAPRAEPGAACRCVSGRRSTAWCCCCSASEGTAPYGRAWRKHMRSSALTRKSRDEALTAMSDDEGLDVLVIGGGVTGAGIALDAATRGLRTGIV